MSSNEERKQLIRRFFEAISDGNISFLKEHAAPDGYFETQGNSLEHHFITIDRLFGVVKLIQEQFPQGIEFTVKGFIAEEDRVVAEVETLGTHVSGELFNNDYLFLFVFEDDKVHHVKEFIASDLFTRRVISDDFMNTL